MKIGRIRFIESGVLKSSNCGLEWRDKKIQRSADDVGRLGGINIISLCAMGRVRVVLADARKSFKLITHG